MPASQPSVARTLTPTSLSGCSWERVKTQQHAHGDRTPARDEEPAEANADTGEGESMDPHEVALAREEVNMLLAEQRKTAALKVGERARARPHPSNGDESC